MKNDIAMFYNYVWQKDEAAFLGPQLKTILKGNGGPL